MILRESELYKLYNLWVSRMIERTIRLQEDELEILRHMGGFHTGTVEGAILNGIIVQITE